MTTTRLRIDRDECIQCATCWQVCPEVFEEGPDDGLSQIVEPYRVDGDPALGEVSEALVDCIQEAAESCPVQIIHLKET